MEVLPIFLEEKVNAQAYFFAALDTLKEQGRLEDEDMIAYLSGSFGEGGGTTFLEINKVGTIISKRDKYCCLVLVER